MKQRIKKFYQSLSSRQSKDAVRLALQSAISAALCYVLMKWWDMPEKFVGVISAVLIVKTSVGGTISSAKERVVATVIGCLIGFACISVIPHGYGTALSLGVSMLVMNGIAAFRDEWRYGVVAAVALALASSDDLIDEAMARSFAIFLGVGVGIATSLVLWPEKASDRARKRLNGALAQIGNYFTATIQAAGNSDEDELQKAKNRYTTEISAARDSAMAVQIANNGILMDWIAVVERLESSVNVLNRVARAADDLTDEKSKFDVDIENLQNVGEEVVKAVGKNRFEDASEKVEEFSQLVKKVNESAGHGSESDEDLEKEQAFTFGLHEIQRSFETILDLMEKDKPKESE